MFCTIMVKLCYSNIGLDMEANRMTRIKLKKTKEILKNVNLTLFIANLIHLGSNSTPFQYPFFSFHTHTPCSSPFSPFNLWSFQPFSQLRYLRPFGHIRFRRTSNISDHLVAFPSSIVPTFGYCRLFGWRWKEKVHLKFSFIL